MKVIRRAAVLAAASLMVATPAFAYEGHWNSVVEHVYAGFGSHTWPDKNLTNTNAYVQINNCTRNANVGVYRNRQWPVPDVEVKTGYTCPEHVYYGDTAAGDYHFTIRSTQNGGALSGDVHVEY